MQTMKLIDSKYGELERNVNRTSNKIEEKLKNVEM